VRVTTYTDAGDLLERVRATLEREEAKHSLILGVLSSVADRAYPLEGQAVFASVESGARWSVAAVMTPPFPLILAAAHDDAPPQAYELIARHLREAGHSVSGVTAVPRVAKEFAKNWERLSGQTRNSEMRQRIYQLEGVRLAPRMDGRLRHATASDSALVGGWMGDFEAEATHEDDRERAREMALRRLARREIYLWEESEARCMVGRSRPTRHTITVNAVYTPPEFRRRGYATAAVTVLSRALLDEGYRTCVLYTDLANPTSNRIYQRIGYVPVTDSVRYLFAPAASGRPTAGLQGTGSLA
jgi:predicted GNAT family acetyltransferase